VEQMIVKILHSSDGLQINAISQQLDCPVHEVSATLFELEMKGVVKLMPGGVYRLLQK
jgi:DNA processing protein